MQPLRQCARAFALVVLAWAGTTDARALALRPAPVSAEMRMCAAVTSYEGGRLSGLFLTEPGTGWIRYRRSEPDEPERIGFDGFERMYRFQDPLGIIFADPRLYVYDGANRTIWSLLLQGKSTKYEAELVSRLAEHPTHIAVSPHGLVAVIEGNEVVFLQQGVEPVRYHRSRFTAPIDLAFSAWNTLQVLDGARNSLVSITFSRLKDGQVLFEREGELPVPDGEGDRSWQGMSIYEGLVYLADERAVYAYLASDQKLVPVATRSDAQGSIRQLALTYESLYLLEPDHVHRYPRTQPVDFALEEGPFESQRALMALYAYLGRKGLLPTREVRARQADQRLEELLFENDVLLVPRVAEAARYERSARTESKGKDPSAEEREFTELLCRLNEGLCTSSPPRGDQTTLETRVPQGTRLQVPWIEIVRRLSKEQVDLDGQSPQAHAEWRVPSAEFRKKTDTAELSRMNPGWSEQDLSRRTKGTATVPVEKWTAIAAVPAPEFDDRTSELWSLTRRYAGLQPYGREAFTEQAARSLPIQPPPPDVGPACQKLKDERSRLLAAIHYPLSYPALSQEAVRVGVLEFASTVNTTHQAFCLESAAPSWHQAANLDLVARPDPATYETIARDVADAATFSSEAHHGTHVSALIGGRQSECWSGLLPRSRLLLVDLTDTGRVRRSIADGVDVDTRVFNVSQAFEGDQQSLHDTIKDFRDRAVFVVAAGNAGRNLNDAAAVPAPARWGAWGNVVTVTGSDWDGSILTSELNHGKRYVDLLAPGKEVYSASEPPGGYGPASGTSQATPLVTAAAAMLVDPDGEARLSPGDAKARLIATADWRDAYDGQVWGGSLDFGAAVRFPQRSFVVTTTGAALGQVHSITLGNDPWIELRNAPRYYERQGSGEIAPDRVKLARILSLRKGSDGRFRVVLREPSTERLKIVLGAELGSTEKVRCDGYELLDPASLSFAPSAGCDSGLGIDQIETYVRGGAYHIRWEE